MVVRKAYLALAGRLHPDKNIGDEQATERFRLLNGAFLSTPVWSLSMSDGLGLRLEAYTVLSDEEKRGEYDCQLASIPLLSTPTGSPTGSPTRSPIGPRDYPAKESQIRRSRPRGLRPDHFFDPDFVIRIIRIDIPRPPRQPHPLHPIPMQMGGQFPVSVQTPTSTTRTKG